MESQINYQADRLCQYIASKSGTAFDPQPALGATVASVIASLLTGDQ
jgi:hypothetical protein